MVRFLFVLLAGLSAASPALAACVGTPGAGAVRLTVEANGVRAATGEVAFTLYPDDKRQFLKKGGKLVRVRVPALAGATSACFWVPSGSYAIALYHDANGDHDFNRTLFVPKEGYGFSNDAPTTFGLPSFDKVRTRVGPGATVIRIRMRYP